MSLEKIEAQDQTDHREALVRLIRAELVDEVRDLTLCTVRHPDLLVAGCHAVGYADPEDAAEKTAELLADAIIRQYQGAHGPIPMVLHCPRCGVQHIDRADPYIVPGRTTWDNPPHRSHLCKPEDGGCGLVWRPADVATTGVEQVKTTGKADTPREHWARVETLGPAAARARIAALKADAGWARRYLNGDAAERAEMTRLQEAAAGE